MSAQLSVVCTQIINIVSKIIEKALLGLYLTAVSISTLSKMTSNLTADMSQLVLYDKSQNLADDNSISHLEALPQELRMEILRYVLHTKYARLDRQARQTKGENVSHTRAFDWTIGVLRTCKTLHADGVEILNKENRWIKMVMRMDRNFLHQSLLNHDVHFVKQSRNTSLNNHIAMITIRSQRPQWARQWKTSATSVLIPLEEVESFCWYLRYMDLPNFLWYNFKFVLPTKLSKSLQRQTLQPFGSVSGEGGAQTLAFESPIDSALTKKLTSAMTAKVGWLRAKAWDIYHCTEKLKAVGDEAFLKGEFNVAAHKYRQVQSFWDSAVEQHSLVKHLDERLDATWMHLDMASMMNASMAEIFAGDIARTAAKEKYESADRLDRMSEFISAINATPSFASLTLYIAGLCMLVQRRPQMAEHAFRLAASTGTVEEKIQAQTAIMAAKSYGISSALDRSTDLDKLIWGLPRTPLASPPLESYICEYAALEKHLCRQLGFSGSFPQEATSFIIEGISILSITNLGVERFENKTQMGLNLRIESKRLKHFPTEGRGSYSQDEINIIEMLLIKRLESHWRLSGRRGRKPSIAQCGQVGEGLPQLLETYKTQYRMAGEIFRQHAGETGGPKLWPKVDKDNLTFHTLKEEQYEELVHLWDTFTQSRKTKFERVVKEMFDVFHRK